MNYIKHLAGFFNMASEDNRLNPTHISLYVALFQVWNLNRFNNPISISRSEMMRVSKICANATYHKVIKQLHEYGYILYEPSYNPFRGSLVHLISLEMDQPIVTNGKEKPTGLVNDQAMNGHPTNQQISAAQAVTPYTNKSNNLNNQTYEQSYEITSSDFNRAGKTQKETHTDIQEQSNHYPGKNGVAIPNSLLEVQRYFEEEKSTSKEAEKFFNYFQSTGWKVGGRAPMKNWRAAARNWILNTSKFTSSKTATHHVTTAKNYCEPL